MKKISIALACLAAASITTHAIPQLGFEFKQNNSAFSLWIEVVGLPGPDKVDISLFNNGTFAQGTQAVTGNLVAGYHDFLSDQPLFGSVGLHDLTLTITDNGNTSTYSHIASYTLTQPVGPDDPADFAGLTGLDQLPDYTFFDLIPDAVPTPDAGSTCVLLSLAFAGIHFARRH